MDRIRTGVLVGLAMAALAVSQARGYINPGFTPVDLTEQSVLILAGTLNAGDKADELLLRVADALKGDKPGEIVRIDLASALPEHAEWLAKLVPARAKVDAMIFAGDFVDPNANAKMSEAYLHLNAVWFGLSRGQGGGYGLKEIDTPMSGTWAGADDMLQRCIRYCLTHPAPVVPVAVSGAWREGSPYKVAKLDGKVFAACAVSLDGVAAPALYLAGEKGDRFYAYDAKAGRLADVTAARKLAAASRQFAWGDFNGDGRVDLASFDGTDIVLHCQAADGTFSAAPKPLGQAERCKGGVLSLSAIDGGAGPAAGLLVGTSARPFLLVPGPDGAMQFRPAVRGSADLSLPADLAKSLGRPGACLSADFDGDRIGDVMQMFGDGALFYKGAGGGSFAAPVKASLALGKGAGGGFVADYDADGLLDVFVPSEDMCSLWQNRGGLKFAETLSVCGSLAYISKPGAVAACGGDLNSDGRQDLLVCYGDMAPQLFFNRGFRCFGFALGMEIGGQVLPEAEKGQQAGCLADFDADGSGDVALVLANGELWALHSEPAQPIADAPCTARVMLTCGRPFAGPLTVVGYAEKRCLGAWNLTAGANEAFFALREAAPITLRWQVPGGKEQQKEIVLETRQSRCEIGP